MKHIKVFENEESEDLRDKRLLDRLAMLYSTGNSELAECDFREPDSYKEYDFYVTSRFGEVGFYYDNFEVSEYTGDRSYDVLIYYERQIGDTLYIAIVRGYGKAYHHEELEEVHPTRLLRVTKKKTT